MKVRLLGLATLLAIGAALVLSGNAGPTVDKRGRGRRGPACQIQVLRETAESRLVKHSMGETEIPRHPQRIASLSTASTDSLVALGIEPVLVESGWKTGSAASYLAPALAKAQIVRRSGGLNLEAVLSARPDLIITGSAQDGRLYGQLSKIAPTVVFNSGTQTDREGSLLDMGEILGLRDRALQRLAEYRQCLKRTKAAMTDNVRSQPVVFLRFRQRTCVIYTQAAMFGPLLFDELGLTPDPAMPRIANPRGWDVLSVERLASLQAEHIFAVVESDSERYFDSVAGTPVWEQIPAVRKHHVHQVAATTWIGGDGVLANEAILRDVLAALAPQGNP